MPKAKKFKVDVIRTEYRSHSFEVEAEGFEEAEKKAKEMILDFNFLDSQVYHATTEIENIEVKK